MSIGPYRAGERQVVVAAVLVACVALCGRLALAQQKSAAAPPVSAAPSDYEIGPGDLLAMTVFGVPELSQASRVSNSGKVHFRGVGIMTVAGKSPTRLEDEVSAKLRDLGLVLAPSVQIRVTEYRAHPVYILGEIMTPGQFVITDEMYLQDLLTLGQGFNTNASRICYLYRRDARTREAANAPKSDPASLPEMTTQEAIKVDPDELNKHPELNIRLQGGDILYCPERRKDYFFVIGDVGHPGLFPILEGQQMLFSRAVAAAGGPTRTAKTSKSMLVRYDDRGVRQEMMIDFDAVMKGKQPDIDIKLNDIIFIPGSGAKTVGNALLSVVPNALTGNAANIR
jgi:polysaccharide biosynthesis/export protein